MSNVGESSLKKCFPSVFNLFKSSSLNTTVRPVEEIHLGDLWGWKGKLSAYTE